MKEILSVAAKTRGTLRENDREWRTWPRYLQKRQELDNYFLQLNNSVLKVISHVELARGAPSPGLEPELSEPKSEVLPITPRRIANPRRAAGDTDRAEKTLV